MSPLETIVLIQGLVLVFVLALLARAWAWIGDRIGEYETALLGQQQLEIGATAPSFVATDLDGTRVTGESFAGRRTLLSFSSVGCAQCEREMPDIEALAVARAHDLTVVGFTTGSRRVAGAWIDSLRRRGAAAGSLQMLVEASSDGDAISAFNPTRVTPYFVGIDAGGRIEARGQVPSVEWDRYRRSLEVSPAPVVPNGAPSQRLAPWSV